MVVNSGVRFWVKSMSKKRLEELYQDIERSAQLIELLREKRDIEEELYELPDDERVGRAFFFQTDVDTIIEKHERELNKLNREVRKIKKQQERENAPKMTLEQYDDAIKERAIKATERAVDVSIWAKNKVVDKLPQRGDPKRTDAERLQLEMDRVIKRHFPELHRQQQQDLKAEIREASRRERPYREAAREIARRDQKEAREEAIAERDNRPTLDEQLERKEKLNQRLEKINSRLQQR